VTRGAFDPPVFLPAGPLSSDDVERVHAEVIRRIHRVLERYDLDPISLGLPPLSGAEDPNESSGKFADASDHEQPLLDFGDARDDSFFPELKAASVQSRIPFGQERGRPLKRVFDPDLANAFEAAGWSGQRVPASLVVDSDGFSLPRCHPDPDGPARPAREALPLFTRARDLLEVPGGSQRWPDLMVSTQGVARWHEGIHPDAVPVHRKAGGDRTASSGASVDLPRSAGTSASSP
jgi:hypothetical protein